MQTCFLQINTTLSILYIIIYVAILARKPTLIRTSESIDPTANTEFNGDVFVL